MTPRIKNAINVWLDAINNGTLAKGTCTACAVGNLVADGLKIAVNPAIKTGKNTHWGSLFSTTFSIQEFNENYLTNDNVLNNIEATSFTIEELREIEYTFETSTKIFFSSYSLYTKKEIREDQLRGLYACIELIKTFDEVEFDTKIEFTDKVNELVTV